VRLRRQSAVMAFSALSPAFVPAAERQEQPPRDRACGAQAYVLKAVLAPLAPAFTDVATVLALHNELASRMKPQRAERARFDSEEAVLALAARKARGKLSTWEVRGRTLRFATPQRHGVCHVEGSWSPLTGGARVGRYLAHGHCGIVCVVAGDASRCVKLVRQRAMPTPAHHLSTDSLLYEEFSRHVVAQSSAAALGLSDAAPLAVGACEWRWRKRAPVAYWYVLMPRLGGCTLEQWAAHGPSDALHVAARVVECVTRRLEGLVPEQRAAALALLRTWDPHPSNVWVANGGAERDVSALELSLLDFQDTGGPAVCCDALADEGTVVAWIAACVSHPVRYSAGCAPIRVVDAATW
jgi:hypothetical protein